MKKPPDWLAVVMNTILRSAIGVLGLMLMFMGAAAGRPLISLIGAVHVVLYFVMAPRENP